MKLGKLHTTQGVDRFARDSAMLNQPNLWPMLRLPLKHATRKDAAGFPLLGYVVATAPHKVILGNIFCPLPHGPVQLPVETFENVQSLLADGWQVD
jgi:hypothetical protein